MGSTSPIRRQIIDPLPFTTAFITLITSLGFQSGVQGLFGESTEFNNKKACL